ncbi:hypothetical protein E2C01_102172 [Portunus trituberculatus]|uniref:Uncharacterized protein n=1 Tax=Portunus trituberculatus TaxID=210409 RepID=A0A5B7KHN6_PORTR|nr:hypothetical protein [Portunus trituberculatus]
MKQFPFPLPCAGCEGTEIMCLLKNKEHCVPPSRVCDGVSECDNGRDEMLCFRLAQLGEDTVSIACRFCIPVSINVTVQGHLFLLPPLYCYLA